jgi:hypothetical protein
MLIFFNLQREKKMELQLSLFMVEVGEKEIKLN